MNRKHVKLIIVLVMLVVIYEVIFWTNTVTYTGEDSNWFVKIDAKLVGLNGSYSIEVSYKGKESIQDVNFNIHPHYNVGFPTLNENGSYYWECNDDCGFYAKDEKLLFFIVWKEGNRAEERMKFIELIRE